MSLTWGLQDIGMWHQDCFARTLHKHMHVLRISSDSQVGCRFWEGIYVLYTYAAKRTTSQKVQKHLSTPIVGGEANILRHMTFCT